MTINDNTVFPAIVAPRRSSLHWKRTEFRWSELREMLREPADHKECGNYVLGEFADTTLRHKGKAKDCTGLHRRKAAVKNRSVLALDVDAPRDDFLDGFQMSWPYAALVHTTWSSTPDQPRYRILIPLHRPYAPDEYTAAARYVMNQYGADQFDSGSEEPERYMFRPSTQDPSTYYWTELPGGPAAASTLLSEMEDDLSDKAVPRPNVTKRDPEEIPGVVGAFNRTYADLDHLIETFALPYDRVDDNRYHLVGATSQAGMGPIADFPGLVYSHHQHDPAYGRACSAFDLVRLHRYGALDDDAGANTPINRLPSYKALADEAMLDPDVKAEMARAAFNLDAYPSGEGSDLDQDLADELNSPAPDMSWTNDLTIKQNGEVPVTAHNRQVLLDNEPLLGRVCRNDLTRSLDWAGADPLPWRAVGPNSRAVTDEDITEVSAYLELVYRIAITEDRLERDLRRAGTRRSYNPLKDHFRDLSWDGTPRLETSLPGADDTPYHRLIARKAGVGAIARLWDPGCKVDQVLVLTGPEGLGKSRWIQAMAKGWSGSLGSLRGGSISKDVFMALQQNWIVVADEGHALFNNDHPSDQAAAKEFITQTHDTYRPPYGKGFVTNPRHCVFWATTNDRNMLRRQEGNRRFLVVECTEDVDPATLDPDYVDQVWAEALHLYRNGEPLYLTSDEEQMVRDSQVDHLDLDDQTMYGMVAEFLDIPLPADWNRRTFAGRQEWLEGYREGFEKGGDRPLTETCTARLLEDVFGLWYRPRVYREELRQVGMVLAELGWRNVGPKRHWGNGIYGRPWIRPEA